MHYSCPVTPIKTGKHITNLSSHLVPSVTPIYVDVLPLADAVIDDCFVVVEKAVQQFGGARLLGWALWEMPSLYLEAEFHAIWKKPSGEIVDLTPKKVQTRRVLFLEDSSAHYNNRQVNNVRIALSKEPAVADFLSALDAEYEFLNRGLRADFHGELRLHGAELIEYEIIQQRKSEAQFRFDWLRKQVGAYDPCLCGSGNKTKWCCKVSRADT